METFDFQFCNTVSFAAEILENQIWAQGPKDPKGCNPSLPLMSSSKYHVNFMLFLELHGAQENPSGFFKGHQNFHSTYCSFYNLSKTLFTSKWLYFAEFFFVKKEFC